MAGLPSVVPTALLPLRVGTNRKDR